MQNNVNIIAVSFNFQLSPEMGILELHEAVGEIMAAKGFEETDAGTCMISMIRDIGGEMLISNAWMLDHELRQFAYYRGMTIAGNTQIITAQERADAWLNEYNSLDDHTHTPCSEIIEALQDENVELAKQLAQQKTTIAVMPRLVTEQNARLSNRVTEREERDFWEVLSPSAQRDYGHLQPKEALAAIIECHEEEARREAGRDAVKLLKIEFANTESMVMRLRQYFDIETEEKR